MWPNTNKDVIHDGSNNFIGIYPNGVDNQWNTGSQTGSVSEVDDISFTLSIIDVLKANFDWEGRFYAYGHSNGAAMANKIAVNGVGFSGIAASASQLIQTPTSSTAPSGSSYLLNSLPNEKATKIAMLSMHGDADGTIPYDGGDLFDTGYVLMSESESQRNYAILNGCGASADTPVETTVEAVIGSGAASTAIKRVFVGCDVTSYQVVGGNHDVANSIAGDSLTKIGIDFFAGIESKLPESSDNSNTVDSDSGADSGVGVFATTHLCATLFFGDYDINLVCIDRHILHFGNFGVRLNVFSWLFYLYLFFFFLFFFFFFFFFFFPIYIYDLTAIEKALVKEPLR